MLTRLVGLIAGFLWWMVRLIFQLSTICILSIWMGIPLAVNRISDQWTREASAFGLPLGYTPAFQVATKVVAYIAMILGWLVLASLTAFLIRLVL